MSQIFRVLAMITVLLAANVTSSPAAGQKHGGKLKLYTLDSPASMSIHEEATVYAERPMMGVFNNLVVFDQHVAQNSIASIVPDLATAWSWSEDGTQLTFALRSGVKGVVVQPNEGVVWNMSPGRSAALKLQNAETAERVMAFEETASTGTDTTFHLHHDSDELIYVLSGEFTFKIADQVKIGGPGTCAFIPRVVAHAWKNTGAEPGRALFLYTPGGAGRMFEKARSLQRPLSALDDREVAEFFTRFGWETVGPSPF
jgi:quercetin dioxygenase-like cupin family protein